MSFIRRINTIMEYVSDSAIGGGHYNTIWGHNSTVSGGMGNTITNSSECAIGGGYTNTLSGSEGSTISGGDANRIQGDSPVATIGGGASNTIRDQASPASADGEAVPLP